MFRTSVERIINLLIKQHAILCQWEHCRSGIMWREAFERRWRWEKILLAAFITDKIFTWIYGGVRIFFPNHFWWFSLIFIKWKSLATGVTPDIFETSRIFQRFFVYFFIFFQKSTTNLADLTLGTSKDILVVSHSLTPHLFQICLIPSSFFNTYL